jgi:hypothetical protein
VQVACKGCGKLCPKTTFRDAKTAKVEYSLQRDGE